MTAVFVVDGHHLLYRAWFGFPTRITSRDKTRDLTGVFGFLALARKAHRLHAPESEIVVVFDGEEAAASRAGTEPAYKANRLKADHAPIGSLPAVKQALDAVGISWLELPGVEGDDVIATIVLQATQAARPIVCYSGDRDFYQLLDNPLVTVLTPGRVEVRSADVQRRYLVCPRQWPDYRALIGDPADNIPGIRGIGPKTASALLDGGWHLEDLKGSPRLDGPGGHVVTKNWDNLVAWRDIIRLRDTIPLPPALMTGRPTSGFLRAAEILDRIGLW